jgi:hypothetical protein
LLREKNAFNFYFGELVSYNDKITDELKCLAENKAKIDNAKSFLITYSKQKDMEMD